MSVLVIEDDTTLCANIARSLAKAGFNVETAQTGDEARSILSKSLPAAICVDISLPDCHGLDLVEETGLADRDTSVIVITGSGTLEDKFRAEKLGVRDYLAKPFSLDALNNVVRDNIRRRTAGVNKRLSPTDNQGLDVKTLEAGLIIDGPRTVAQESGAPALEPVTQHRLHAAKRAFSTRRVSFDTADRLIIGRYAPSTGDVVLARIKSIGQHPRIELPTGRRARLFVGDEIILAYGNRYAPDQFEGELPDDLGDCQMVAAGGIAARCLSKNRHVRRATDIEIIGVLADHLGRPLNLSRRALPHQRPPKLRPPVIAVFGTSMNAGKTTTAANAIFGFTRAGLKVGAAKITGTGAGGDDWFMTDAGACEVLDFTDCGVPSTYKMSLEELESIAQTLVAKLCQGGAEVIMLEVADGIFQRETRALISSPVFRDLVDHVVFAASDAAGAVLGATALGNAGYRVVAISGAVTSSPLSVIEAERELDLKILKAADLQAGRWLEAVPPPERDNEAERLRGAA